MKRDAVLRAALLLGLGAGFSASVARRADYDDAPDLGVMPLETTKPLPRGRRVTSSSCSIADMPHEHKREIARRLRQQERAQQKERKA